MVRRMRVLGALLLVLVVGILVLVFRPEREPEEPGEDTDLNRVLGEVQDTEITAQGQVEIEGVGKFTFDPEQVATVRPDLFRPGFFSIFDVLVHLDETGQVEVEHHFDERMNTHVITSINGEPDWWYQVQYDGGWPEQSVFRPDHYHYKDATTLKFLRAEASHLERIYETYREEVARREANGGRLVVPLVIIQGRNEKLTFEEVEITPHNLRSDYFQEDVITALDVILTLADLGKITYELKWYHSMGSANVVGSYWVERINQDRARGRCGFVYEAGSDAFQFFSGNHVHSPADVRIINSPAYVKWFWICI